jgi:hypothetical protein
VESEVELETGMHPEIGGWVHVTLVRFSLLCLFMMYDTSALVNNIGW